MRVGIALLVLVQIAGARAACAQEAGTACPPPPPCPCHTCEARPCPPAPTCPPRYAVRRFDEDWGPCLCKGLCERGGNWSDLLKAVPLTRSRFLRADVGGQLRTRFETYRGIDLGAPAEADDGWVLLRLRAHGTLHVGRHARLFVEGIFADQWTRDLGPRADDENEGDLLNAFVEVGADLFGGRADLRVGRQELLWGKERLLGPSDWSNTRRTFQGISARAGWTGHALEGFWARPVVVDPHGFDEWDTGTRLWGVLYRNEMLTCLTAELYVISVKRDQASLGGTSGAEDRTMVGLRFEGTIPGTRLDYDGEGGYQFGDFGDTYIVAGMTTLDIGWRPCGLPWSPRFSVGGDWVTGDTDPADGRSGTYDQLFPSEHPYLGDADLIGRQNLVAARGRIEVQPMGGLALTLTGHAFWRQDDADAVYAADGGVLRPVGGTDASFLGYEIDLQATWQVDRQWEVSAGLAHFLAGEFFRLSGPAEDTTLVYFSLQGTF